MFEQVRDDLAESVGVAVQRAPPFRVTILQGQSVACGTELRLLDHRPDQCSQFDRLRSQRQLPRA